MRRPDVPIVGDCQVVITELIKAVKAEHAKHGAPDTSEWITPASDAWQEQFPLKYQQDDDGPLKPQFCVEIAARNTPDDRILVAGVGQHQMWASQLWKFKPPAHVDQLGRSRHDGLRGSGRGRRQGRPARSHGVGDRRRRLLPDDRAGARDRELRSGSRSKIAILNNAYLGMVRQWQELFYEERYSEVYLSPDLPDYVKWAEAMGCVGMRVDTRRRRRPDDREGERDRRPPGRDRLPHRLAREGVPDGARGRLERQHHPRPRVRRRRVG